jgi:hypothetical protein
VEHFLRAIFLKMVSSEIGMSSICPSVCALFLSRHIAFRELKFCTEVRWCVRLNSTVRGPRSVIVSHQLYHLVKNQIMCSLFPRQHGISYLFKCALINMKFCVPSKQGAHFLVASQLLKYGIVYPQNFVTSLAQNYYRAKIFLNLSSHV